MVVESRERVMGSCIEIAGVQMFRKVEIEYDLSECFYSLTMVDYWRCYIESVLCPVIHED